ncbi:hypothetical protein [Heliophilum fasciatum]|uniref:hypothetical protein n=1 Tax=Heliophilum fasciatum TaxID=35700 RepID=UPI001042C675|nr:hypothetical protein [Heliophilum fasciatum]MCW2279285.1 hypothetical protein [Heliophilum fasciatum]
MQLFNLGAIIGALFIVILAPFWSYVVMWVEVKKLALQVKANHLEVTGQSESEGSESANRIGFVIPCEDEDWDEEDETA